jgi:hypothetical protein
MSVGAQFNGGWDDYGLGNEAYFEARVLSPRPSGTRSVSATGVWSLCGEYAGPVLYRPVTLTASVVKTEISDAQILDNDYGTPPPSASASASTDNTSQEDTTSSTGSPPEFYVSNAGGIAAASWVEVTPNSNVWSFEQRLFNNSMSSTVTNTMNIRTQAISTIRWRFWSLL